MARVIEFDDGWKTLQEEAITKLEMILGGAPDLRFTSEEYIKLYTVIYNMCIQRQPHDYSRRLYDKYRDTLDDFINSTVLPSLGDKHDEFFLMELRKGWNDHTEVMVRWLSRFFQYLDRYFAERTGLPRLGEAGLACFRDLVHKGYKSKTTLIINTLIDQEREGARIDGALLKGILEIYISMGAGEMDYYENDFETAMLKDTATYYSRKASVWITEDSCPDYMLKAEECLKKEKDRVFHYLHKSSETKLLEKVRHELLAVHRNQLLEKETGCGALLRDNKLEDLSRMYSLFHQIPEGLEHIANIFKKHVSSEGMNLISETEEAMSSQAEKRTGGAQELALMKKVITLHDKYLAYVNVCFSNDSMFHKALKAAFESFCNKAVAGLSSTEILASYCDDILRKGGAHEKQSDETADETLEKAINLLVYISDKDLFAEFYRKKLSRRLLFDRSANDEYEKLALTKLKQQCGGQFTLKMARMVNDMALAKENQQRFQAYLSRNRRAKLGMDLSVTVITTGFWPTYKSSDLNLPSEMVKCVEVFNDFYQSKTKHRKLTWIYSLGNCYINGKFEQKTIELILTTFQAAVLLLFNNASRLSYTDIKNQLKLGDEDLVRLLHSLSCAKHKILNKEPNTKSVSPKDYFEFNSKFTDKMRRIKIPLPLVDERKKVVEVVEKDRRYNIDAALVRIMKSRKVLGYQQLIAECVEQLSHMFKPDLKEIKKRIEDLIARDYLERDPDSPNTFRYLA